MITPRRTRLVRVADLHAFRRTVAILSLDTSESGAADPIAAVRGRLVVVPTRGAARQLRRTVENESLAGVRAVLLPDFVTREQLYDRLAARLPEPPRCLLPFEREVIIQAAAQQSIATGVEPPFRLRPRLVAEIVRFYDQLRRQGQTVARFEKILEESLERDTDLDRGAERMLRQTRFLAGVYRIYEQRLAELSLFDEHALREHLIGTAAADPVKHVVVTIADWIADPSGLYRADFDLMTRLPALEAIDVVATEGLLASGFHQRVHEWLPGIEEVDHRVLDATASSQEPTLVVPMGPGASFGFVSRDREEELVAIARRVKSDAGTSDAGTSGRLDRTAIVFKRPLPYLYLARDVFDDAAIPYQTFDALPLAAEPFAAALDLVLEFVTSQFTRAAIVALLRSPHFDFGRDGQPLDGRTVTTLDRALREARYLGEYDRLRAQAEGWTGDAGARSALVSALEAAEKLQPLIERAPASAQLTRLVSFLTSYARTAVDDERNLRARAAILGVLEALAAAHAAHDDRGVTIDELAPDIRRWIEEETFVAETGDSGMQLLDAQAARYGDFDDLFIIGLVEGEWPERPRPNVFYPPGLLAALGWPSEEDRRSAATAAFLDLVRSASRRVAASTFILEDEALVQPSPLVDDLGRARLQVAEIEPPPPARVFSDEALSLDPPAIDALDEPARRWAALRLARTAASDARYHGQAGPQRGRTWSVSAVETYLTCPFKFFAHYVLRLEEKPDDDEVMDPKKQGRFLHEVFQRFFATWQERGHGAITPDDLDTARALFAAVVEEQVTRLPEAEAALQRTRLLGSSVAEGLGEIVFRMEAERPMEVVERLLEYPLEGEFEFAGVDGPRRIGLRGVADRLDLLADGTIRLIDYKSSVPQKSRSLQLPIYGVCAEQRLAAHHGTRWTLGEAAYIAFRGPKRVVPLFPARSDRDDVLRAAQRRLIEAFDGIARGEFPPTPDDVFLCGFCSYAAVCRKDYVGDV